MPQIEKQTNRVAPKKVVATTNSAWDLGDHVRILMYGQSGTGKTTLWATFPDPILAIVCSGGNKPGELRSVDTPENRKRINPQVAGTVARLKELIDEAKTGKYATVVLDHASGMQDMDLKEELGIDEIPVQKSWGLASQRIYGTVAQHCKEYFRALLGLPCNVVIVAQERTFNDESGSEIITPTVGAALIPSLTGWLNPACDYVVQAFKRARMIRKKVEIAGKVVEQLERGKGVEYCLRCEPHDVYQTKFRLPRGKTLPDVIVDPSYAKIKQVIQG